MTLILVIEDKASTRDILLECLEKAGFDIISAENGHLGVQQAQQQLPDLIICAMMMPEVDGYGVLIRLRQDQLTSAIPIIVLTAKATKAEFRHVMELGADDYLSQPFTVEELLRAIAARLEKQAALQEWYAAKSQQVSEPRAADTALAATLKSIFPSVPHLSEVFNFIEANYHRSITLGEVAQAVDYSPTYLSKLVQQKTGQSFYYWIVERRMTEARSLLLQTDQAVNQIAAVVGYQDACHFSRQFRKLYGTSPQAWRSASRRVAQHKQERKN